MCCQFAVVSLFAIFDLRMLRIDDDCALMAHVGETDISKIETSLCDFYSHKQGRHPLGHDVLALSGQIRHIPKGVAAFRLAGLSAT